MGRGLGLQDRERPGPLLATSPDLPRSPAAQPPHNLFLPVGVPPPATPPDSHLCRARPTRSADPHAWASGSSAKGPSARDARPAHRARLCPALPRPRLGGVPRRAPGAAPPRPLPALDPPRCATSPARLSTGQPLPGSATPRGPRRSLRGHAPARARTRAVQPRPFHPFPATTQLTRSLSPTPLPAPPRPPPSQATPLMPAPRTRAYPAEASPAPLVPRSRGARSPPAPPSCHPLCVSHPHGLCGLGAEPPASRSAVLWRKEPPVRCCRSLPRAGAQVGGGRGPGRSPSLGQGMGTGAGRV